MRRGLVGILGVSGVLVATACSSPYGEGGAGAEQAQTGTPKTGVDKSPTEPVVTPTPTPMPVPNRDADGGAGGGSSMGDAAAANPDQCPSKAMPVITPWKAPPGVSTACSASDMTYFASVAANQTWLGIESLMKSRNANCARCIFSHENDAQWRPIVYFGTEGNAVINYASCFARAAGGSEACGRGVDAWSDCYAKVCDSTACGSDAALNTCYASSTVQATCKAYDPTTTCGGANAYNSLNNVCGTYIEVARVLCSGGN